MKRRKAVLITVLAVPLLVLFVELAGRVVFDGDFYAARVSEQLGGAEVTIGSAVTSVLRRTVRAESLEVRHRSGNVSSVAEVTIDRLGWGTTWRAVVRPARGSLRDFQLVTAGYRLAVLDGRASLSDSLLVARSVSLRPLLPMSEHLRHGRPNRYDLSADSIAATGFAVDTTSGGALEARTLALNGFDVEVYSDRHLAPPPREKALPNEMLSRLDRRVRVGALHIDGRATYHERSRGARRAGKITFARLVADADSIDSGDPKRSTRLDLTTWINDAFPLSVRFDWRLGSPRLHMRAEGGTGSFDARVLNTAFPDIAGTRLASGKVERIRFAFSTKDSVAGGTLVAIYDSLGIEKVSKEDTSKKKFWASLLANIKVSESHMPPRDDPREGTIEHVRDRTESIFTFLWFTLRSGLRSMVGA